MRKLIILGFIVVILTTLYLYINYQESFEIRKSQVEGVGVFAIKNHKPNEKLFLGIYSDKKIEPNLGGKINHCPSTSKKHNSRIEKIGDEWFVISNKDILKGEEITTDYNNTPYFISKPDKNWTC
jgi:SET domain-containing protein